jgi:hypothetical protein
LKVGRPAATPPREVTPAEETSATETKEVPPQADRQQLVLSGADPLHL